MKNLESVHSIFDDIQKRESKSCYISKKFQFFKKLQFLKSFKHDLEYISNLFILFKVFRTLNIIEKLIKRSDKANHKFIDAIEPMNSLIFSMLEREDYQDAFNLSSRHYEDVVTFTDITNYNAYKLSDIELFFINSNYFDIFKNNENVPNFFNIHSKMLNRYFLISYKLENKKRSEKFINSVCDNFGLAYFYH